MVDDLNFLAIFSYIPSPIYSIYSSSKGFDYGMPLLYPEDIFDLTCSKKAVYYKFFCAAIIPYPPKLPFPSLDLASSFLTSLELYVLYILTSPYLSNISSL